MNYCDPVCAAGCPGCLAKNLPFYTETSLDILDIATLTNDITNLLNSHLEPSEDFDLAALGVIDHRYVLSQNWNARMSFSKKPYSIIHINTRSLLANLTKLKILLYTLESQFDFIACSETWLNSSNGHLVNLPGYNFIHQHRDGRGGGVGIFIRDTFQFEVKEQFTKSVHRSHECLTVKLSLPKGDSLIISVVYRSPSYSPGPFLDNYLPEFLTKFAKRQLILTGDFNLNLLEYNQSSPVSAFLDLLYSHNLLPSISLPTRITLESKTLIDNIFSNLLNKETGSAVLLDDISDHLPITFSWSDYCDLSESKQVAPHFNFSETCLNNLKYCLSTFDWNSIKSHDISDYYDNFLTVICDSLHRFCKSRGVSKNYKIKIPWLNPELLLATKVKNNLYKQYQLLQTPVAAEAYKLFRNKLSREIRLAKKMFYSRRLNYHYSNSKQIWQTLNELLNMKSKKQVIHPIIDSAGTLQKEYINIASSFNEYFVNVGNRLSQTIPVPTEPIISHLSKTGNFPQSMFLEETSSVEITQIFRNLKKNGTTDVNSLSGNTLKKFFDEILIPFTDICNLSLSSGGVPNAMKVARVSPIFKKGQRHLMSNYRPISVLPYLSKILERIFEVRLRGFLMANHILCESQYGFLSKRSPTLAAIDYYECICEIVKSGRCAVSVSLDLSKAFDTLDHGILFQKLEYYGVRGLPLSWLRSYLNNRSQKVSLGQTGIGSPLLKISCGVPQGSVLGPVLFLIYINDIVHSSNSNFFLFADDTTLLFPFTKQENPSNRISNELNKINLWLQANRLSLNAGKTQSILFGGTDEIQNVLDIKINNFKITLVDYINFLGITFDSKLSWQHHINYIKPKIARNIGIIRRLRNFLPQNIRKQLYFSLIYPYLTYGVELWGCAAQTYLNPIVALQKRALRVVAGVAPTAHTGDWFGRLCIIRFDKLYGYHILLLMFKAFHTQLPGGIQTRFKTNVNIYNTRQSNLNLVVTRRSTKIQNNRPSVSGPYVWNSLNPIMKELPSFEIFKSRLKSLSLS